MRDEDKTKEQLITELAQMRQRIAELTALDAEHTRMLTEARERELLHSSITDIAADAIVSANEEHRIILYNRGAEQIFGYSPDEVIGKPLDLLLPQRFQTKHRDYVNRFGTSSTGARYMNQRGEIVGQRKNGEEFPAEATISTIEIGGRRVYTAILRDITERKRMEEALRESEKRYHTITEANLAGVYLIEEGALQYINPALALTFGASQGSQMEISDLFDYIHPDDHSIVAELLQKCLDRELDIIHHSFRGLRKDGDMIYLEAFAHCIERQGKTSIVGTVLDITERKRAEEALQSSQRQLQALFDNAQDAILIADDEARYVDANPAACALLGYSRQELLQMTVWDVTPVPDREVGKSSWQAFIEEGNQSGEYELRRKDGAVIDAEFRAVANFLPGLHLSILHDITERKRIESENRLLQAITQAIAASPDFHAALGAALSLVCETANWNYGEAWIPRPDGTALECSPAWYGSSERLQKFRTASQEMTFPPGTGLPGRVWSSRQPEWIPDISTSPDAVFLRASPAAEAGLKAGVGVPIVVEDKVQAVLAFFLFDSREEDPRWVGLVSAVAAQLGMAILRKRAEDEVRQLNAELEQRVIERTELLRQAKDRAEAILNSSGDAIVLASTNRVIQQVNPAFQRLFGYLAEDVFGIQCSLFFEPESESAMAEAFQEAIESGQTRQLEAVARRKDGTVFDAAITLSVIGNSHALGAICIIRDTTPRKQVERALRETLDRERQLNGLKSRFVSMVSHEFRTPLAVVLSSSELLRTYGDRMTSERRLEHLNNIASQVRLLTDLLDDVLTVARAETVGLDFKLTRLNLEGICRNLAEELQQTTTNHLIRFSSSGDCSYAEMDEKLLRQIITNLLSNAIKYSPDGGIVQFELSCDHQQATIRVKDEGIGIPEADQQRLFENFHRAENVGSIPGTGLGLAIVKRAVEAHNGTITFESRHGIGTTFIVNLLLFRAEY